MRYDKRLEALAYERGLCVVHMTPLWCHACDYRWVGTDAEFRELWVLLRRYYGSPTRIDPRDPTRVCPRHPEIPLWCEPCWDAAVRQVKGPCVTVPAAAAERYDALMCRYVPTAQTAGAYPRGDPRYVIADACAMAADGVPMVGDFKNRLRAVLMSLKSPDRNGGDR